jgi:hypothetical protein
MVWEDIMRLIPLVSAAFVLVLSGPALAQTGAPNARTLRAGVETGEEWIEYVSRADFFSVNFPAQPQVRDTTFATEYGLDLPGRVHAHTDGRNKYSVTVIDYGPAEKIHTDRSKACTGYPDTCGNRFRAEIRGALDYAAWQFIQRDAKVTHYANYVTDLVEGRRIQLLNPDKSQTFAAIHVHENRLYILEGTVPAGSPPPGLFQQSLGFVDQEGNRVRYATVYNANYPIPRRTR